MNDYMEILIDICGWFRLESIRFMSHDRELWPVLKLGFAEVGS